MWDSFKQGRRCYKCGHIRTKEKQRLSEDEVRACFASAQYEMLGNYVGSKKPLAYRCPQGHEHSMAWSNFKKGKRCLTCAINRIADNRRRKLEDVRKMYTDAGCIPLFETYHHGTDKLPFICACGRFGERSFNGFRLSQRCAGCKYERVTQTRTSHGNVAVSSQQLHLHELYGGVLNYPCKSLSLDIAFPDEKIYVEYDGSGHMLSVILKDIAEEDFKRNELRRTYALYRDGWKCLRIISRKDRLPSDQVLTALLEEARQRFQKGDSHCIADFDHGTLEYAGIKCNVDFGELRCLKRSYRGND